MKEVPCSGPFPCRNIDATDENGDHDLVGIKCSVQVPDSFSGPAFCSIECLMYARLKEGRSSS